MSNSFAKRAMLAVNGKGYTVDILVTWDPCTASETEMDFIQVRVLLKDLRRTMHGGSHSGRRCDRQARRHFRKHQYVGAS